VKVLAKNAGVATGTAASPHNLNTVDKVINYIL
jgi:hypothetical protein